MTLYAYKNNRPDIHPTIFIAPTAQIIGNVKIGKQSSIWFQTVIRGDLDKISVGERTNIQDLCMCHADENIPLKIGDGVTIGHRCVIHGCIIEDECLIGMGSIVMNQAVIGKGSIVAAGTVVLEKTIVPPYSLVTGSPGKVKKTYENREGIEQKIKTMSETYMDSARIFGSSEMFYEIKDHKPPKNFKCIQCGNCCLNLNDAFQTSVSGEDVAMWEKEGRFDILEWVHPIPLGDDHYIYDIWISPKTGEDVWRCPWLRKLPKQDKYICRIHDVKPEHCRNYPRSKKHADETECRCFE